MPINIKSTKATITKVFCRMKLHEALTLHPSEQRQRFLNENEMSIGAQTRLHNYPRAALDHIYNNLTSR